MEDSAEIKPGINVNIVVNVDIDKEITDVRSAIIYDVIGTEIIISQTNPPFTKYHIGRIITVTRLIKRKNDLSRIGFTGRVANIISDYNLSSSTTVLAVVVKRETGLKEYDLRMHYRVKPTSDSNINLYVEKEKVNLIDISLGGAQFSHARDSYIELGITIKVFLVIDGNEFTIEASTIRAWSPSEGGKQANLKYVSVRFLTIDRDVSYALGRKIMMIQRENLSLDKGF